MEKGSGFRIKTLGKKEVETFNLQVQMKCGELLLDILDFAPLGNVDYSGGLIITDWFNEETVSLE